MSTFVTSKHCRILAAAAVGLWLAACASDKTEIGAQIEQMSSLEPASGLPSQYVEMFPGGTEGCGYPARDARVWNTHPVRTIKASFARILPGGVRDSFDVQIPAGEIMTVEQCSAGEPELIAAYFADQS